MKRRTLFKGGILAAIAAWFPWTKTKAVEIEQKPQTLGELAKENSRKFTENHKNLLNRKHNHYKENGLDDSIQVVDTTTTYAIDDKPATKQECEEYFSSLSPEEQIQAHRQGIICKRHFRVGIFRKRGGATGE